MSCTGTNNCTCGCCSGTGIQTPLPRDNLPGLAAVSYRVGAWSSFNESMLARLSSSQYPALAALKTRDNDDFTVALLDASAVVLDVLSFYQERLANEGYLRTAQQLRSLTELSRLIGYQPSPGVSASTYAAFTLKAAPGLAPDPTAVPITIPQGTQVQSVPAQGQTAQTFETAADIKAKADWNALPVQTSVPWIAPGVGGVYLAGTQTRLQPGDSLLLLGVNRENWTPSVSSAPSPDWQVVVLNQVKADTLRNLTYVSWSTPLEVAVSTGYNIAVPFLAPGPAEAPERAEARVADRAVQAKAQMMQTSTAAVEMVQSQMVRNQYGQNIFTVNLTGNYLYRFRPLLGMRAVPASDFVTSPWASAKVFAFRQKASLFGHNAPNPKLFAVNAPPTSPPPDQAPDPIPSTSLINTSWTWIGYTIQTVQGITQIDLDASYPKVVAGSWFAMTRNDPGQQTLSAAQLYNAVSAQTISRSDFALSGKVTRLAADYQNDPLLSNPNAFTLPSTEVWLQSEQLPVADQPLTYPLYGTLLDLQDLRPDIVGLQVVAIFGKRQKVSVAAGITGLSFVPDDGTVPIAMNPDDVFTLSDPAPLPLLTGGAIPDWSQASASLLLSLEDANGRTGLAQAALNQFVLLPSGASDPEVSEYALASFVGGTPAPYAHTQIQLQSALANCYERSSTTVNANVALVTQGQSVSEIMGSGNASTPNQSFTLKQFPLTYVQAPTPTGRKSTLQVQVNGAAWTELTSLYGAPPMQPVFDVLNQPDGTSDVFFGDGEEGAVLPTGQSNILANYRTGLGSAGNVPANTLTTLIDRPLGVSGVTNPGAATGGQGAQSIEDIRINAPLSVLTLGRAVSLSDYENYAGSFAGIAKAHALWIPSGPSRGVFLTVAGAGGAALPPANPTLNNLIASLKNYGNPLIPVTVQSFVETLFGFSAEVQYDPAYQQAAVRAQILQTLSTTFGFAQQGFGQAVSVDGISTVIQNVTGVIAVNVHSLTVVASSTGGDLAGFSSGFSLSNWSSWITQQVSVPRPPSPPNCICAYLPAANTLYLPLPAEILVLDPDPSSVVLGVMS
jgi:Baseplate J-like protein